jgi:hypothetical protein
VGSRSLEAGGDKPHNHGLSEFKPLSTDRGVGWGVKKPEEPKQQPTDPDRTLSERFQRERGRNRSGVAGGEAHNETYRRLLKLFEKEIMINDKE